MTKHKSWKYNPDTSTWLWRQAIFQDIPAIVALAEQQFQCEIEQIFTPEPEVYAYNLAQAITHQIYNPTNQQLIVAIDKNTNMLLGYAWIGRGTTTPYSSDEMAEAKMAHVDLTMPVKTRYILLAQMLEHWITWTRACAIPVLVSTSIRQEQQGFLKLHQQQGFTIRGSIGYLKL